MVVATQNVSADPRDHVVHFYDHDSELARTVGRYLRDTFADGGVAVVIATDAHCQLFMAELAAQGIDPEAAVRDGTLVMLDAAVTLTAFMPGGNIDGRGFQAVLGSIVRRAGQGGRPVRAYGEMVALLWEDGNVLAAIELEGLWNDLRDELEFSLLCAYRSASVQGAEHAQALQQVCHLHSAVLPATDGHAQAAPGSVGDEASSHFPAELDAPGSGRRFVAQTLEEWGHSRASVQDAQLIVTELITNAVIHARSASLVVLRAEDSGVRISVHDHSLVKPRLRTFDPTAPSGRGLHLVDAISAAWGFDLTRKGKVVWADLSSAPAPR